MKRRWIVTVIVALILVAVILFIKKRQPGHPKPADEQGFVSALAAERQEGGQDAAHLVRDVWYKNSIIYTVDIKMFKDTDGDGIGDIKGLIQNLDYIKSLGTDIIWLPPFYPTMDNDDGYDITDYYHVDPRLGTMDDFKTLVEQAKQKGMRVIIDLVLNHTSINHPWFQESRSAQSPRHNWYIWSPEKPKSKESDLVFKGYQKEIWTYDSTAKEYYYHRFYNFEPDFNTQNPDVKNEMWHIMHFWLATGIAGFRIDAVTYLTEMANTSGKSFDHDYTLLKQMRLMTDSVQPDNILLGEANVPSGESDKFFGKHGESLNMIFNFYADQRIFYAMATEDVTTLNKALNNSKDIPLQGDWVYFLRNQDEMGMGRFKESERQEVYRAFAPEKNMQLYDRGVRRRLAPMFGNNLQRLKMAYGFLYSLQGVPMMRYGDEIGMGDDLTLKERLAVRTPMQWDSSTNGGFSTAAKTFRPVISSGLFGYKQVNVQRNEQDSASLLNWIKKLAAIRKANPAIAYGDWQIMDAGSKHVFAIQYNWNGSSILSVQNFSRQEQLVGIAAKKGETALQDMLNENKIVAADHGAFHLLLEPYGYRWYVVK